MRRLLLILLLIVAFVTTPQYAFSRNYVFCVGINTYSMDVGRLRVSTNDAKTIKKVFKKNGRSSVSIITDSAATCEAVLRGMKYTFSRAKSNDVVIFFFSGHGTEYGLLCYDGILNNDKILNEFKQCKAGTKMIIADACYSGKLRNDSAWREIYNGEKVILFLSSRTDETSIETVFNNSLFTIYLERGLRGGADTNKDRAITARELYDFVHEGVTKDSRDTQHPVMWGEFDGDMPIIKWENKKSSKNK